MGIKFKKKKSDILPEAAYEGSMEEVKYKPNAEDPKKVILGYQPDGTDFIVPKEYGASLAPDSPLRRDLETLNGGPLDENNVRGDYRVEEHIGQRCKFDVMHKAGSGGRPTMVATLVKQATTEAAAVEITNEEKAALRAPALNKEVTA